MLLKLIGQFKANIRRRRFSWLVEAEVAET
jgi:hypothetical protein